MYSILFVSDLHGIIERYKKTFEIAIDEKVNAILIGGDLASGYPKSQKDFFETEFRELYEKYENDLPQIYAIPGNDDCNIVLDCLKQFDKITVPIDRAYSLCDEYSIVGYPFVPISPFHAKDFEKWDLNPTSSQPKKGERIMNMRGFRSEGENKIPFEFDEKHRDDTIENDLERLASLSDPKKTVYLFHSPPYNIHDKVPDFAGNGYRLIGSHAIRNFILQKNSFIAFYGHNHAESPEAVVRLGDSYCIACGANEKPNNLNYIILKLKNKNIERIIKKID